MSDGRIEFNVDLKTGDGIKQTTLQLKELLTEISKINIAIGRTQAELKKIKASEVYAEAVRTHEIARELDNDLRDQQRALHPEKDAILIKELGKQRGSTGRARASLELKALTSEQEQALQKLEDQVSILESKYKRFAKEVADAGGVVDRQNREIQISTEVLQKNTEAIVDNKQAQQQNQSETRQSSDAKEQEAAKTNESTKAIEQETQAITRQTRAVKERTEKQEAEFRKLQQRVNNGEVLKPSVMSKYESLSVRPAYSGAVEQPPTIENAIKAQNKLNISRQRSSKIASSLKGDIQALSDKIKRNTGLLKEDTDALNANALAQQRAAAATAAAEEKIIATNKKKPDLPEEHGTIFRARKITRQAVLSAPIYGAAYAATGAAASGLYDYMKMDSTLNRIAIVTDKTTASVQGMREEFTKAGKELGVTGNLYAEGALIFFQQGGKAVKYANELTTASIQLANATGKTSEDTSKYVTAIGNSFKLIDKGPASIQKIADVLLYLDKASAASADEIGEAMTRSAASFESAGVSYERAGAMIATVLQTTRLAPERVGTAFKTILQNIQEVKKAGPEAMVDFTSQIQKAIDTFPGIQDIVKKKLGTEGLSLFNKNGTQIKDVTAFLNDLQSVYGDIKDNNKMAADAISQAIAGKQNANVLQALLQNKELFDTLFTGAQESLGTAKKSQEEYLNSIQAKINQMKATWEEFINKLIASEGLKSAVKALTGVIEGLNGLLGDTHQLLKLIGIIVLINIKKIMPMLTEAGTAIKGMGTLFTKLGSKEILYLGRERRMRAEVELLTKAINDQTAAIKENNIAISDPKSSDLRVARAKKANEELMKQQAVDMAERDSLEGQLLNKGGLVRGALKGAAGSAIGGALVTGAIGISSDMAAGDSFAEAAKKNAGGAIGGGIGAAIGSIIAPGIGTVIGGMVGSYAGDAIAGSWIASAERHKKEIIKKSESLFSDIQDFNKLDIIGEKNLTPQQLEEYAKLEASLRGYSGVAKEARAANDELARSKENLTQKTKDYFDAMSKNLPDSVQTAIAADLNQAVVDNAVAKQKQLALDTLQQNLGKVTPGKAQELGLALSTAKTFEDIEKVIKNNPDVFKGIKDQIKGLQIDTKNQMGMLVSNAQWLLDNLGGMSDSDKVKNIQSLWKQMGISDDVVMSSKLNAEQLIAIAQSTANILSKYNVLTNQYQEIKKIPTGASLTKEQKNLIKDYNKNAGELEELLGLPKGSLGSAKIEGHKLKWWEYFSPMSTPGQTKGKATFNSTVFQNAVSAYIQKAVDAAKNIKTIATTPGPYTKTTTPKNVPGPLTLTQRTEQEVALDTKRLIESLDRQIKDAEKYNGDIATKTTKLVTLYEKRIEQIAKLRVRVATAMNNALNNDYIQKYIKNKNLKIENGKLTEESIQSTRNILISNARAAEQAFNAEQAKGQKSDPAKLSRLKAAADAAEKALANFNEAIATYNKYADEFAQATDELTAAIDEAKTKIIELYKEVVKQDISKKLFGKESIERVKSFFDTVLKYQEQYLDNIEKGIGLAKIDNKIAQDKIKYGNLPELVEFQKRITLMKKQGKDYSEAELKTMDAEYNLLLKQIMLKRLQQGSQETQLMRDEQGNWIYAAKSDSSNAEEIAAAKGEIIDAAGAFYESAKANVKDTTKKIYDIVNDLATAEADKTAAIAEAKKNGKTADVSDYDKRIQYLEGMLADYRKSLGMEGQTYKRAAGAAGIASTEDTALFGLIDNIINGTPEQIAQIMKGSPVMADVTSATHDLGTLVTSLGATLTGLSSNLDTLKGSANSLSTAFSKIAADMTTYNNQIKTAFDVIDKSNTTLRPSTPKPTTKKATTKAPASKTYTGKRGDTLQKVMKAYGLTLQQLIKKNPWLKGYKPTSSIAGKVIKLESGGYTGDSEGLALLHKKELILNKADTKNILNSVKIARSMGSAISGGIVSALDGVGAAGISNNTVINANFPNVTSSEEIKKAFANMSNSASQYAHKMRNQLYQN